MKSKFLQVRKMLLVAAGLLVGASGVWADDIYKRAIEADETNGVTAWSSTDVGEGAWVNTAGADGKISDTNALYIGSTSGSRTMVNSTQIVPTTNAIVTYEMEWAVGSSYGTNNECYLMIGNNIKLTTSSQGQYGKIITEGNEDINIPNACSNGKSSGANGNRDGDVWTVKIVVNTATHKITTLTIKGNKGTDLVNYTLANEISLPTTSEYSTMTMGTIRSNTASALFHSLNSIFVTEEKQTVTTYNYTINYKDGENVVKTISSSSVADAVITADIAIDGEGDYMGKHYLIMADQAPTLTITSGENVLNVPVRAPYTATLSVTTNIGGVAQVPVVTNLTETDNKVCAWSFSYPIYAKSGDTYYACDETAYVQSGTFEDNETITKIVEYSTAKEDIMGFSEVLSNGTDAKYSGGDYGPVNTPLASCTLGKGVYAADIYVVSKAGNGSNTRNEGVFVNGENKASTPRNTYGLLSLIFIVDEDNSEVCVKGLGTSDYTDNLDYVVIRKIETVSVEITSAGWATLYTPCALDFSGADGLTAYTATCTDETVTLTKVENVPAYTGVVLQGAAKTYNISAILSSEIAQGDLKGSTTEALAYNKDATNDYYMLALNDANEAQFTKLTSGSIAAGKAYLELPKTAEARVLSVVFAGETTGIAEVEKADAENDAIYNLSGQRVSKPANGLYIVNGKKVVLK